MADQAAAPAHTSKRKQYMMVFIALIVLTALELGVVYMHIGRVALITALIGLALAKAAAVAMYFMHLKEEARFLKLTVGVPLLVFPPLYAFVLIAEALVRRL
jgi:caa(3)-type oxidase subunit IV